MQDIFVGLSGGVDSAVSAALLKRAGYDVTGVFIKIWQPAFIECTWEKDRIDAMRVAAALGIPFREVDLSDEYQREVVGDMTRGYAAGYTPNPDVACNERIKFGAFASWAFERGADRVATGHYARIVERDGAYELHRGIDHDKDQSYFLYRMPRACLERSLFPVGGYTKPQVRNMAVRWGLPVAQKRDSQGLCFVGDVDMRDFLKRFIEVREGYALDTSGAVVGSHRGASLYTVGQRHGFTLTKSGEPHYVVSTDIAANTIVVSARRSDCLRDEAKLRDEHWLCDAPQSLHALAQTRYRETPVRVRAENGRVRFDEPHMISPGQDLVLFDGERVLGGARLV